jgi:hypothetical protein
MRTLVAKHNRPPYQNEGLYPAPSGAKSILISTISISNPHTQHAYAYVSAAQYDALIAACYYKNYTIELLLIPLILLKLYIPKVI